MTLELRKPGAIDVRPPVRERARAYLVGRRMATVAVSRRHAWTVWQVLRQVPGVLLSLVGWSPLGLARLTAAWARYLRDHDTADLGHHHAGTRETKEFKTAHDIRKERLTARWMINGSVVGIVLALAFAWTWPRGFGTVCAALIFVWVVKLIPGRSLGEVIFAFCLAVCVYFGAPHLADRIPKPPAWAVWLAGSAVVLSLGWAGRPKAAPLLQFDGAPRFQRPTAPMLTAALCSLGNSKMKEPDQIRPLMDVCRPAPGVWRGEFELPQAVTATWVMDHREELSGALRFPLGCVWPSAGRRHSSHLILDITETDLKDGDQDPWPLLTAPRTDLSKPLPQATDQRGDWVNVTLAYANVIIGAVPRVGKTFFLRQLLMTAGLDPQAKVYAIDGKGTGDLSPCQMFAHRYVRGVRSTRPELIEKVREMVRELREEMDRRADIIDSLSHDECPESKVTGALIHARPDLRLGWIVVGIDETQMLFGYGDRSNKEHRAIRDELKAGITELVKLGPALGIIVILATQDVVEETIPTQISRMAVIRFCMKVEDYQPNDRVLGTGAYKRGIDATMFSQEDIGIGYLKAEGSVPRIVRTVYGLDKPACEPLAARARALRVAAGTISGDADDVADAVVLDFGADVRRALSERSAPTAHLAELVEWLREMRPDYERLTVAEVGQRARNARLWVGQVWRNGRTTAGVDLRKQPEE